MKKLLAAVTLALTLAVGGSVANAAPAEAAVVSSTYRWHYVASTNQYICMRTDTHKSTWWDYLTNSTWTSQTSVATWYCISRIGYP